MAVMAIAPFEGPHLSCQSGVPQGNCLFPAFTPILILGVLALAKKENLLALCLFCFFLAEDATPAGLLPY